MANKAYKQQVRLLLDVLPEIAKESCFALHGGTAINLFVRDMPRLSVDIDLTYIPIEDRASSLQHIGEALERIKLRIETAMQEVRVSHKSDIGKLLISSKGAIIKVEVNLVGRGTIAPPVLLELCDRAQSEFDVFTVIQVVPLGQLYGGKICAALDRQHPRDLFDVKYLLANEGFTDDVKHGLLLSLLGSDRPTNEIISPNFQDQRSAMINQFAGMSIEDFSYDEYEDVRRTLVQTVHAGLTKDDRDFLIGFNNATPDWDIYNLEKFPAVQWKLRHLNVLKETNHTKHQEQLQALKNKLIE